MPTKNSGFHKFFSIHFLYFCFVLFQFVQYTSLRGVFRTQLNIYVNPRRFYFTGDMTNLYPFIQGSLERPFSELFSANARYGINTNILHLTFSRILIISYKMLIIRGISNGKINELHRQELASLIRVQEKLKTCRSSKLNFSSSCFIADDSHVKTERLHVVVFSKHDILHF